MQVFDDILKTVGNTPVLSLDRLTSPNAASLFGKFEAANPSLSVKDRTALAMIEKAEADGLIKKDTQIVAATAGNTGVALAMVCAVKKYPLVLFMPEDASLERRKMFEAFGATLHLTSKNDGVSGAVKAAEEFKAKNKNTFDPKQFENPAAVEAHRRATAQEILADFPDGLDALVVGVGTAATITGVGEELKKKFPSLRVIAVEPQSSAVLSGGVAGSHRIQQLGHGFIPKNYNPKIVEKIIQVSDADAYTTTKRLSRQMGLLLGLSSGANVFAALQVAEKLGKGKKVLTFLCDAGQRYFSIEKFFTKGTTV
ncbi:cysteine synthase A [bacterium]|nr:cysteine synthase A [bacterium]